MNKKDYLVKLGKRIAEVRKAKGMSQSDLANACDKDQQSIHKVEHAIFTPTIWYLHDIARGLKVPLSELLKPLD